MGTIGTGQADGAAEQNPAEAWRSRNLVVKFREGCSLSIQGGTVKTADICCFQAVGRRVMTEPRAGEELRLEGVDSCEVVDSVVHLPAADQQEGAEAAAAADGAAKEETAAAPEAEQPAAAAGDEAAQDSAGAGSEQRSPLVDAILYACELMMRLRKSCRTVFAQQFLSLAAAAEIMRGAESSEDFGMYETINERMAKLTAKDEAQQMAALFMLHTCDDPEVVEVARQKLGGVDKKVTATGIGRFSLTDFQKAGCPPADLEKLRALIASAPTAAQQQAQQQEGSAAHVG